MDVGTALLAVYNIFKIILRDVDTFFNTLAKVSNDAEISHNEPTNKGIIAGNNVISTSDSHPNEAGHIKVARYITNEIKENE